MSSALLAEKLSMWSSLNFAVMSLKFKEIYAKETVNEILTKLFFLIFFFVCDDHAGKAFGGIL